MKKISLVTQFTFILILCFAVGSALAEKKAEVMVKSKMNVSKGTLTITAKGKPTPETADPLRRRYEAHAAALLVAQNEMVTKLKGKTVLEEKEISSKYDKKQTCTMTYLARFR